VTDPPDIAVHAPADPHVALPLVRRLCGLPGVRVATLRLHGRSAGGEPGRGLLRRLQDGLQPARPPAASRLAALCEEHGIDPGAGEAAGNLDLLYGVQPPGPAGERPALVVEARRSADGRRALPAVLHRTPDGKTRVLAAGELPIEKHDTAESIHLKLQLVARDLVVHALQQAEPKPNATPSEGPPLSLAGPDPTLPRWAPRHPPDESALAARGKRLLAALYLFSGWVWLRNLLRRRRGRVPAVIVNFHRVADSAVDHWMTLDTPGFDRMMAFVERHYRVVSIEELQQVLARGHNREAIAAITFDDGYRECASAAAAVLETRGMTAAFYHCSGFLDGEADLAHDARRGIAGLPKMSPAELRDLAAHGFEVGSHTVSHVDLRAASGATIRDELHDSKIRLEEATGTEVSGLSVPWGSPAHCRPEVFAEARAAGYRYVLSHFDGVNFPGETGYHLRRVRPPLDDVLRLHASMEGWRGLRGLFSRAPERIVLATEDEGR
jgi:peptidoglycan/xylan/chitin deacetylase (PgdA/CDA1 family)